MKKKNYTLSDFLSKPEDPVLIICEKPKVAGKIAFALGKPEKKRKGKAIWFKLKREGKKHLVVPACGHLFTLDTKGDKWDYPAFKFKWYPIFKAQKKSQLS